MFKNWKRFYFLTSLFIFLLRRLFILWNSHWNDKRTNLLSSFKCFLIRSKKFHVFFFFLQRNGKKYPKIKMIAVMLVALNAWRVLIDVNPFIFFFWLSKEDESKRYKDKRYILFFFFFINGIPWRSRPYLLILFYSRLCTPISLIELNIRLFNHHSNKGVDFFLLLFFNKIEYKEN